MSSGIRLPVARECRRDCVKRQKRKKGGRISPWPSAWIILYWSGFLIFDVLATLLKGAYDMKALSQRRHDFSYSHRFTDMYTMALWVMKENWLRHFFPLIIRERKCSFVHIKSSVVSDAVSCNNLVRVTLWSGFVSPADDYSSETHGGLQIKRLFRCVV